MTRRFTTTSLLVLLVATLALGAFDAAREGSWDHFLLFAIAGGTAVALAATYGFGHPVVPIRVDLLHWATERSHLVGEPVDVVTNRAIASYRDLLAPPARVEPPRADDDAA